MKMLNKFFSIILIGLTLGIAFFFRSDLEQAWKNFNKKIDPCGQPIAYSIGEFDSRFGLSKDDFIVALAQAEEIWEKSIDKSLFVYDDEADFKINLIYDERQDSTATLKKLGLSIENDKDTYEALKIKYEQFNKTYAAQKIELDNMTNYYNQTKATYEDEVKASNKRGGVNKDEYAILEEERKSLNDLADNIAQKQKDINATIDNLNATASVINRLNRELNLNVKNYNTVGQETLGEFQEGAYIRDEAGERINVYQFDDQAVLVRLLGHEFGHALGLEHLDNPKAIMYRLNQASDENITADDISALKLVCQMQ